MVERVAVLGATGSIGDSTLELLALHSKRFDVYALSGHSRLTKLLALCQRFKPKKVAVPQASVDDFRHQLKEVGLDIDVVGGEQGLIDIASDEQTQTVVAAIVGAAGLGSTLAAAHAGKRILLANKEALVMAGSLMMRTVQSSGATLLPLDSEHNAIFQCLPPTIQLDNQQIHDSSLGVKKLWLTASGGPFLNATFEQMQQAGVAEAVKHPNWSMGRKISVDSATMMNKGLELIEACHLFDLAHSDIEVAIHPQSIIHSMVEYSDGSFLAQMGSPDMKTPIAHALAYPKRIDSNVAALNLFDIGKLEFIAPDLEKFACLRLAREAMQIGQAASIALNAANEVAVDAFLQEQIKLTDIATVNERVMNEVVERTTHSHNSHYNRHVDSLSAIMQIDKQARQTAQTVLSALQPPIKSQKVR